MASTHVVQSTAETVRSGYLDPAAKPVAVIEPGDTVRYPDTWTHWGNEATFGMSFADREPLRHRYPHGPYSMLGPVEVTGAQPGDVVEVSITALRTASRARRPAASVRGLRSPARLLDIGRRTCHRG